ncbi:LysR family transcriptional regulator [Sphingomonas sp. G124]|uniref:LysR family transcriptional regulator n=1 Tax=Sphingomonas cremea TaxID=2904799 RepID=A0A9X1QPX4_9SPHN|nr:LysR family transcriptional regulator [Sphingomonas cremea]MCF2515314.1 LysR family transcriptional regulator [Sphingomonas cremea]
MTVQPLLSGVPVFVEAVTAGGFSAAATRLNRSRSAVGKTIARLESQLGVRLFHRTTRVQRLTDEGQLFYEYCLRALAELGTARTMLEAGRQEAAGQLKVSLPILLGRRRIAPILTRLVAEHPNLDLVLRFTDRVVDLVAEGFDLAVRNGPLGYSDGLSARRIGQERMILCVAPSYLELLGTPASLLELTSHRAVTYARPNGKSRWLLYDDVQGPVEIEPSSRLALDDLEAIADAAEAGLGIAWLPKALIEERLASGGLVQLFPDWPSHLYDSYAVWPTVPHMSLRTRVAIDALAAGLSRDQ